MSERRLIFISHPEVVVDPACPIEQWSLNERGTARARIFACSGVLRNVAHLWSSAEKKAQDTAAILSDSLQLEVSTDLALGENDRSATGFLPPHEFEAAANEFFANPNQSFKGWETAQDAQNRIVRATNAILGKATSGDVAIVSHGGVGTLLLCHLKQATIDRKFDQPSQGHYWVAALPDLTPLQGWKSIG